eukprot:160816-Amorphochlora_amoeboformis.AAC.1
MELEVPWDYYFASIHITSRHITSHHFMRVIEAHRMSFLRGFLEYMTRGYMTRGYEAMRLLRVHDKRLRGFLEYNTRDSGSPLPYCEDT